LTSFNANTRHLVRKEKPEKETGVLWSREFLIKIISWEGKKEPTSYLLPRDENVGKKSARGGLIPEQKLNQFVRQTEEKRSAERGA